MSNNVNKNHLRVRALTEGAILLALGIVLNYLSKLLFVNMPQGGSVTLGMFPILFYAHRWGVGKGLLMGFTYGLLDMLIDSADPGNLQQRFHHHGRPYDEQAHQCLRPLRPVQCAVPQWL